MPLTENQVREFRGAGDDAKMTVIGNVRRFWFKDILIRQMPRIPIPTMEELDAIDRDVEKARRLYAAKS